jgi:nucleotide-binding universal stress UspA family protein
MKPTLDHVLVATDFSPAASAAIDYAAALARSLGARLHLVHVLEEPFVSSPPYEWHLPDTPARREERYQRTFIRLSRTADAFRETVATTVEIRTGALIESIAEASVDYGADLIVLGTRGRRGFRHPLAGDSAERLQQLVKCPILTVRPRACETDRTVVRVRETVRPD